MSIEKYTSTHKAKKSGFKTYQEAKEWAEEFVKKYLEISLEPKSVSVLIEKYDTIVGLTTMTIDTMYNVDIEIDIETDVE